MNETGLVIAIDFGTHASGFAYASVGERAKPRHEQAVTMFRDWPGGEVFKYFKTRTALLRSHSGEIIAWGNKALIEYGTLLRQGRDGQLQLRDGFKLDLTSADSDVRARAIEDAADYLKWLREKALATVNGGGILIDERDITWCITMPVTTAEGMTGYDSVLRDNVAGPAGFPAADRARLILVAEPEAAALHAKADREPGERFTIVDAGGGTVDITTLQVNDDYTLDQVGLQAGGKFGSRILDDKFLERLHRRLREIYGWQQNASPNPVDWATIINSWEEDKRTWDFSLQRSYRVRIPRRIDDKGRSQGQADPIPGDGDLEMSSAEILKEIFEPVVSSIIRELDKAHMDLPEGPPVREIVLVGGFGGSPYLKLRLAEHLAGKAALTTLEDPGPAEAVLHGAVSYALNPEWIRARRIQHTYACDVLVPCERPEEPHQTAHSRVRSVRWGPDEELCSKLLVFARRSEIVKAGTVRDVIPLYPADCRQQTVPFSLYISDENDPYFPDGSRLLGRIELPTKIPWWRSRYWRPIDIKVTLGDSEVIFRASDRRHPEILREIRLSYFEANSETHT
jgi:hypothetical protein